MGWVVLVLESTGQVMFDESGFATASATEKDQLESRHVRISNHG